MAATVVHASCSAAVSQRGSTAAAGGPLSASVGIDETIPVGPQAARDEGQDRSARSADRVKLSYRQGLAGFTGRRPGSVVELSGQVGERIQRRIHADQGEF